MMTDLPRPADAATPYVDDVLIATPGKNLEEALRKHEQQLRQVLKIFAKNHLYAEKSKCRFFQLEVEYCGHILRGGTRRAAPGKPSAVENWPKPTNVRELRGFLGLTGFYSPYVRYYADLAAPLSDLLQAGKFDWRREHDDAFAALKKALFQNVVLHIVDFHKPFFMRTDASKFAVGAVLEQH